MFFYALADRWGEADPRKIADLPDEVLAHWQAYLSIVNSEHEPGSTSSVPPHSESVTDTDDGFAACYRILGHE